MAKKDEDNVTITTEEVRIATFTIRLPGETHDRLRRIAFDHETSMNALITEAISDYLAEHDANDCFCFN